MSCWVIYMDKYGSTVPKAHECKDLKEAKLWAEENSQVYDIEDIAESMKD